MNRDSPEWKLGQIGERIARIHLQQQGYYVVRTSDITGGAPMMEGQNPIILPDILAALKGQARWVEIKYKQKPTEHRAPPHRWEHGIAQRLWYAYRECERVSGIPAYLCVVEGETRLVLIAALDDLLIGMRHSGEPKMGPMFFFDRLKFIWEQGPSEEFAAICPITPRSVRTLTQPPAPTFRQLMLL